MYFIIAYILLSSWQPYIQGNKRRFRQIFAGVSEEYSPFLSVAFRLASIFYDSFYTKGQIFPLIWSLAPIPRCPTLFTFFIQRLLNKTALVSSRVENVLMFVSEAASTCVNKTFYSILTLTVF